MLCIINPSTDPYFNLAAEEHLLKNVSSNCFMLWRNEKAIVIGKHQNALAEINTDLAANNNIPVIRRLSGGGTVYHDPGNLNFTFIMNGKEGHLVDFQKYTLPVIGLLKKLSVEAVFQGKNNLTIGGRKFSGNAEHVYKRRVLHHGTLLFSSSIDDLNSALLVNPLKYKSKAVKSIRSRVTNIKEHLSTDMDVLQFRDLLMDHIVEGFPDAVPYDFTPEDIESIGRLRDEKYITWEWNFGYSPPYDFERTIVTDEGIVQICFSVSGGIIQKAVMSADFAKDNSLSAFAGEFTGKRHQREELLRFLKHVQFPPPFRSITAGELIRGMF